MSVALASALTISVDRYFRHALRPSHSVTVPQERGMHVRPYIILKSRTEGESEVCYCFIAASIDSISTNRQAVHHGDVGSI